MEWNFNRTINIVDLKLDPPAGGKLPKMGPQLGVNCQNETPQLGVNYQSWDPPVGGSAFE